MEANYTIYNELYQAARDKGWQGWGGDDRIAQGHIIVDRLFAEPFVLTSGKALELGCGEGQVARQLADRGFAVTGIDVADNAIVWAQEKSAESHPSIVYYSADLTHPSAIQNGPFDIILDGNCYHCIIGAGRQQFLANVHDALAPDGIFFISTMSSATNEDQLYLRDAAAYRFLPSKQTLLAELAAAQFEVLALQEYERTNHNHISLHAQRVDGA